MAITIRSSSRLDAIENNLAEVFDNKTSGAETVLDAWQYLRVRTLEELKGRLTKAEWFAIIDVFNGTMIEPRFSCSNEFIKIQLEDGARYDGLDKKWKLNLKETLKKVDTLTSAQTYFLLEEVNRFWEKDSSKPNSLDDFVKKFL